LNIQDPASLGAGATEKQTLTILGANGTFTLRFNGRTTGPINIVSPTLAAGIQSALNALASIGGVGGSVTVTQGTPPFDNVFTIDFGGTLAFSDQPQLIANASPSVTIFVTTLNDGPKGTVVQTGATLQVQG